MDGRVSVAADPVVVADGDVDRATGLLVEQHGADQFRHRDVRPDPQFREVVRGVAHLLGGLLEGRPDLVVGDPGDLAVLDVELEALTVLQ